ncbi:hypothetical protein L1987_63355 [Smallanthus sonchifolius]|uniref:Uncharacterized protein n=1 Tax=Smallanthus sonchifolius TaxID=185202 RepID=A0ACB9CD25_9ASTR|nr:hypothetical protein L1987_63355 [Smallanthus sonchifolius]
MLRRVVSEEVENGLRRRTLSYSNSSALRLKALEPSTMQLKFRKHLTLPIFTGTKILDEDGNPLEICLVDIRNNQELNIDCSLKLQIVVLDGDFPCADGNMWTSDEFEKNIVKERRGKRPLLAGEVSVTMKDGVVSIGDIELTDNSSWIRSRKFRIAARVVPGSSPDIVIREAMTEAFVVKDHRGELYKKHHPPMLEDDVWRLEKIGKDGAFHKKLVANDIKTVQDFLMLSVVNEPKLRKILGIGMSDKMWEVTINHARRYAYQSWNTLEVVDGLLNNTPLLTQGDMMDQHPSNCAITMGRYDGRVFRAGQTTELSLVSNHDNVDVVGLAYDFSPVEPYNFSESSSQGAVSAAYNFIG